MGKVVVIRHKLCYLVGVDSKDVYPIIRSLLEPDISKINYDKYDNSPIQDIDSYNYFNIAPWSEYYKKDSRFASKEEVLRNVILNKMPKWGIFKITKEGFEKDSAHLEFSISEFLNLLEAYCWVSGIATCECIEVGNGYDYNISIFKKSNFSFLGSKGDLMFTFRWSEFEELILINHCYFDIITKAGNYGGWLKKTGFGSKDDFKNYLEAQKVFGAK